jgi:alginate O-acetyltransferase complex protein AlgI
MVFTSWPFVLFFSCVLGALSLAPSRHSRQLMILLSSVVFYGYWNKLYLLLLATPSIIDYLCAMAIEDTGISRIRKRWLIVSITSNLGLLGYFKYTNFFLGTVANILGRHFKPLDILLPIGISFYTFKTLSYTIDVYRRDLRACRDWWKYAMFVTYFPELIAGPIVRASVFLPQMTRSLRPSWKRASVGMQLILLGASKKLLIADRLAVLPDAVFARPQAFAPSTVVSAVAAYSLQIYCDFSGYSDIAIGVSRIIGFDLPENFNMPYLSTSVTEFWRRWHMTLSQWLRDYLYIPLGGNRRGRLRTYINLMITMLLGGLWHGASWTFVIWGLMHGTALAAHKLWIEETDSRIRIPRLVSWALTYSFVCVCWVFFRAADFHTAIIILRKVTFLDRGGVDYFYLPLALILPVVVAAHWLGSVVEKRAIKLHFPRYVRAPRWAEGFYRNLAGRFAIKPSRFAGYYVLFPLPGFVGGFFVTLWLLVFYMFASVNTSPFIYFQF